MSRGLEDMWRSVLLFVPTALAFAAIVLAGYVVARVLRTATAKILARAGLDRTPALRPLLGENVTPSGLCAKIVFYAVLLFALQLAFGLWGPNPVSDLLTAVIAWLPRAFVAIVIIVVAAAIARAAADLIVSALGALPYARLLSRAVSVVIVALGVIAALDQVRIATSITQPLLIFVLATVAGVVIVGVGGGLIRPMQSRWDQWLDRAGAESAVIRDQARAYAAQREASAPDPAADETQVIPPPRSTEETVAVPVSSPAPTAASGAVGSAPASPIASGDPGSAPAPASDSGTAVTDATPTTADTTVVTRGPNDTIVIGGADETQVIPRSDPDQTGPIPTDPENPPAR
ncbi:hypothetical protein Ade02nite_44550 [Paractinoplanes deccanensis]|uniref:Transporter (Transmembrane protein) n=1 Tax=Paractinoplanes deccanensis TaxID=113561 RepID=A0ABQ3Y744_9ACTN|nr:hypothetical protein [Actinoplanes deccanensis]GID75814.1 hypothetical protein Ade02nite_44550 [Actinoplanes deccanensis]